VDHRVAYTLLVVAVGAERLAEVALSRRNQRWLAARGAVEAGAEQYPWMVALHSGFLASCVAEVWLLRRPFVPPLAVAMGLVLAAAMVLRAWTMRTLGRRWTVRVLAVPGEGPVAAGPYRLLDHPNYLAVVLEVAALPLVHTAWLTAVVFSVLDGMLLRARIRVENRALGRERPGGAVAEGEAR
jgi:methyltransferase